MADFDEIKNRFAERVRAKQAESADKGEAEAGRLEALFAPISTTVRAITAAIAGLGDARLRVSDDGIRQDGDGNHYLTIRLSKPGVVREIRVLHSFSMRGRMFWIDGLSEQSSARLTDAGATFTRDGVMISEDQGDEVAASIEVFAEDFFGELA